MLIGHGIDNSNSFSGGENIRYSLGARVAEKNTVPISEKISPTFSKKKTQTKWRSGLSLLQQMLNMDLSLCSPDFFLPSLLVKNLSYHPAQPSLIAHMPFSSFWNSTRILLNMLLHVLLLPQPCLWIKQAGFFLVREKPAILASFFGFKCLTKATPSVETEKKWIVSVYLIVPFFSSTNYCLITSSLSGHFSHWHMGCHPSSLSILLNWAISLWENVSWLIHNSWM